MSYVQVQTNRDGEGREATYVHVATSEWDAVKRRSVQRRLYGLGVPFVTLPVKVQP